MTRHIEKRGKSVLECKGLSVGYKNAPVIRDINIGIERGEFVTLLGPNGAGKTTLLRTLSRHLQPVSGTITIDGRDIRDIRQAELARIMAVVLTEKVSPPLFDVFQFVALGRYPHTDFLGRLSQRDREVVQRCLRAVHAEELQSREFASLSDGEKQKVLVARALAQEPAILLLDEPTAHLDLKHRMEVMTILRHLCQSEGIAVIASLHDVDIASKVSDRVALVKDGVITHFGYPEEVLTSANVSTLYDFDSACFSSHLGSIELRGDCHRGRVFVVAGMGTGASVYRTLAKQGYALSTGVLLSNDLDCFVAKGLGAECIVHPPESAIPVETLAQALTRISKCQAVIDTGFYASGAYKNNLQLIEHAATLGKPVFSLRQQDTAPDETRLCGLTPVNTTSQLLEVMEERI